MTGNYNTFDLPIGILKERAASRREAATLVSSMF